MVRNIQTGIDKIEPEYFRQHQDQESYNNVAIDAGCKHLLDFVLLPFAYLKRNKPLGGALECIAEESELDGNACHNAIYTIILYSKSF